MKIWMIPMKGKGHEVTARNLALADDIDIARHLTTDEWDNMLLIEEDEEQEVDADNGESR